MTHKTVSSNTAGDSTKFGSADLNKINNFFNGNLDVDTYDINSPLTFRSGKCLFRTPGNLKSYTILASEILADYNLTLPLIAANDEFLLKANTVTVTGKTIDAVNNTIKNVMTYSTGSKKWTQWWGLSDTQTDGFAAGFVSPFGTRANTRNATEGMYVNYATGATIQTAAGFRETQTLVARQTNPYMYVKFRINQTQPDTRAWFTFDSGNATPNSDDAFNAKSAFGLGFRAADTTWQVITNDDTGATGYASAGIGTIDTAIHTIELVGDDANTRWGYSFDGGAYTYVTTDTPAQSKMLLWTMAIQNNVASSKTMDLMEWRVGVDK